MGCPIRKFSDQSLFAAPQDLSQRTTSFIASQRQGIRRIPFRHLIVLEIRKRTIQGQPCLAGRKPNEPRLGRRISIAFPDPKRPVLLQTHPGARGQAGLTTGMLSVDSPRTNNDPESEPCGPSPNRAFRGFVAETGCASSSRCHGTKGQPRNLAGFSSGGAASLSFEDRPSPPGPTALAATPRSSNFYISSEAPLLRAASQPDAF
jgi:hypothetical protein